MISDRAVHSDFLIHWTGKDIDESNDPEWPTRKKGASWTNPAGREAYHQRLLNTLKFGLWMTTELEEKQQKVYKRLGVPPVARCCFTELKLSESRAHARRYGRLGIGVKRPFLFERLGRPLAYFGFAADRNKDPLLDACIASFSKDQRHLLNFFQPMNNEAESPLSYDLYSESEWRVVLMQRLLDERLIIDPRDAANGAHHKYFLSLPESQQKRLNYLIPLDGWFSMIIYPSGTARNEAQRDESIRKEILRIKQQGCHADGRPDRGNSVEGGSWPIELGLDNCRDF